MSLLARLRSLRAVLDDDESVWVEFRAPTLLIVNPVAGRGLELCGDDSDTVLSVLAYDLLVKTRKS